MYMSFASEGGIFKSKVTVFFTVRADPKIRLQDLIPCLLEKSYPCKRDYFFRLLKKARSFVVTIRLDQ